MSACAEADSWHWVARRSGAESSSIPVPIGLASAGVDDSARWVMMAWMNGSQPTSAAADVGEDARAAVIARLHHLYVSGGLSLEDLSGRLEGVLTASSQAELADAMSALPPVVALTPAPHKMAKPLVLRAPDSDLRLGPGWQLAADTTIRTGSGRARLDLTAASWDALDINLRLETWGSLEIIVPEGAAVQVAGGTGGIRVGSLSPPLPGGPVIRVSTMGPTGIVRIRHP